MPAFYAVVITDAATDGEIAVSPYEARASLIPALRMHFTRAGIEWCR